MKHKELWRTVKYVLIAASAGLIEIGSFTLMNELLHWNYWVSYLIALVLSVLWNFTINRRYTFKSASNVPKAMALVFAYYCVFTPLSTLLEHYLTTKLGWNEYLVTAINMVLNLATEFPFQRFVVFRNSIDTNELAAKDDDKDSIEESVSEAVSGITSARDDAARLTETRHPDTEPTASENE